jgi:hypothetical protein
VAGGYARNSAKTTQYCVQILVAGRTPTRNAHPSSRLRAGAIERVRTPRATGSCVALFVLSLLASPALLAGCGSGSGRQHSGAGASKAHAIDETASLKLEKRQRLTFTQQGPVSGTLAGRMLLRVTPGGPGAVATFMVTLASGTLIGRGTAKLDPAGSMVKFTGKATITGGTGAYTGASAEGLRYTGIGAADGSSATIHLRGDVTY